MKYAIALHKRIFKTWKDGDVNLQKSSLCKSCAQNNISNTCICQLSRAFLNYLIRLV
uniref:Uncharacterized protein n=1 Tax=Rhizophora mucronata TaxID=61149 RepID=A0A2P2NFY9_RHIMU